MANASSELQQRITEATDQLLGLEGARDNRQGQIAELEAERRKYMVAARARKDPKAQAESERLALEIEGIRREKCDDEAAIDELSKSIEALNEELQSVQWQARCERLRSGVRVRLKGDLPRQIADAAKKLGAMCEELRASDEQLARDLRHFDPFLYPAGQSVYGLTTTRGEMLLCALGDNVPNVLSRQWQEVLLKRDLPVVEAEALQGVLRKIDRLEKQGPTPLPIRNGASVRAAQLDDVQTGT